VVWSGCDRRRTSSRGGGIVTAVENAVALVLALLLIGYLSYALVRPEKF
jgi:K+-transporting ATPase KdpF subunit